MAVPTETSHPAGTAAVSGRRIYAAQPVTYIEMTRHIPNEKGGRVETRDYRKGLDRQSGEADIAKGSSEINTH